MTEVCGVTSLLAELTEANEIFPAFSEEMGHVKAAYYWHQLLCEMESASEHGDGDRLAAIFEQYKTLFNRSPLLNRIATWPRGYAGDFETIDMLINADVTDDSKGFSHYLEGVLLSSWLAQQHRNKIYHQQKLILQAINRKRASAANVLSLACGACRDVEGILSCFDPNQVNFVLSDNDAGALESSQQRLEAIASNCSFVEASALKLPSDITDNGPYDLIMIGGLFDYLPDRAINIVLSKALKLLAADGTLYFSNIKKGNPYKRWLDVIGWPLIHRDEADIQNMIASLPGSPCQLSLFTEETGLTLLAEVSH